MVLTRRVLVIGQELHHALILTGLEVRWSSALSSNLEVDAVTRFRVDAAHFPRTGIADAALRLTDGRRLLVHGDSMSYQARNLEFFRGKNLQRCVETHEEVVIIILVKDACKGLLVHGRRKTVRQDHVATGGVGKPLHLKKADLIQAAGKDIDDMTVMRNALG